MDVLAACQYYPVDLHSIALSQPLLGWCQGAAWEQPHPDTLQVRPCKLIDDIHVIKRSGCGCSQAFPEISCELWV